MTVQETSEIQVRIKYTSTRVPARLVEFTDTGVIIEVQGERVALTRRFDGEFRSDENSYQTGYVYHP